LTPPDENNTQHLSQEDSNNVDTNTSQNTIDALESGSDVPEQERGPSPQNIPFKGTKKN
jgi:hypothetical protein